MRTFAFAMWCVGPDSDVTVTSEERWDPRLYTTNQGSKTRYYADLRDIGGDQVALKRAGDRRATTDKEEAARLFADMIKDVGAVLAESRPRLREFVDRFLEENPGGVAERWLKETRLR